MKIAKWPVPIGIVSLVYGLLFGAMHVRPPIADTSWLFPSINIALAVLFFAGGVGVIRRAHWGFLSLLYSSYIMLAKLAYTMMMVFSIMGGMPPVFALLAILTMMLPTAAWPVFLIIWVVSP